MTEVCDGELVELQSFSFSKKRAHSWTVPQEEMRYGSSSAEAFPPSRRRMMQLTPVHRSHSLYEERQRQIEVEDQIWSARDRTIIAQIEQYLEESCRMKVEVEELESLLGPEDLEMNFRRISKA